VLTEVKADPRDLDAPAK